jgi:hypothetical protein
MIQFGIDTSNAGEGIGCGTQAGASEAGVGIEIPETPLHANVTELASLLPDGVNWVTITDQSGSSRRVAVNDNAFVFTGPVGGTMSFTRPDGEQDTNRLVSASPRLPPLPH